ncbi:MAG: ubiquitin-like domain-containing protein [Chloroflexota bacterium]|nr:ubiquitin-like domain-containing protein [Chloroflexota bacterium]
MFDRIKTFLSKHKKALLPAAILMILVGAGLTWLGLNRTVTVIVNRMPLRVRTPALTVSGVLRAAEVQSSPADRVQPSPGRLLWNQPFVTVETAREVVVRTPEFDLAFPSAERIPANLLALADVPVYPNDQVRINGAAVSAVDALEMPDSFVLQYVPAQAISLELDGVTQTLYSSEPTLGAALETAGIKLSVEDAITLDPNTPLTGPLSVAIRRARPLTVQVGEQTVTGVTAAETVGEALQDLDIPLQNLDYSQPGEAAALPEDGQIRVVRVREELMVMTDETPFPVEYQEDPETPLDQTSVIEPGQNAIVATRERVGYADGEEVWRRSEDSWQASEAKPGIYGYGTKIVNYTEVVDGNTIEYYRKISVYYHSYKPCIPGTDICYYGTSSGLPVEKGVIAVQLSWYNMFALHPVYVPGYGHAVIADVCGACAGEMLIDLGYSEDNYDPMPNGWTTLYFLSPAPDFVPVPFP